VLGLAASIMFLFFCQSNSKPSAYCPNVAWWYGLYG